MRNRGRPRSRKSNCPAHIDASKIPNYCYWDNSGNGHWYTVYSDHGGKKHRRRIAGADATMSELYRVLEKSSASHDCLNWLSDKFESSAQFKQVSTAMQKDWRYCRRVACEYPTKIEGISIGEIMLSEWSTPLVQRLIDGLTDKRGPSSAKHVYTYLKRVFNWGVNRGYCLANPVQKIELPKERKRRRNPDLDLVTKLISFAQERSKLPSRTLGSCPHFIWMALELAYLNRLRGIEVFSLSDADELKEGLVCTRTKGSRTSITRWNPRLRACVDAAKAKRAAIYEARRQPTPFKANQRPLLVNTGGLPLKQSSWQTAWRRFMDLAVSEGILTDEERFGLHDMKRRGATDTKGSKFEKMDATGHSSLKMLSIYDMSVAVVDPASD